MEGFNDFCSPVLLIQFFNILILKILPLTCNVQCACLAFQVESIIDDASQHQVSRWKHVFKSVNTLHAWFLQKLLWSSIVKASWIPDGFELVDISNKWKSIFSFSREREWERGWPFPILHPCRISHSLTSTLHFIQLMHFTFGDNLLLSTFVRSLSFNLPSVYYACIIILIILWFLKFTFFFGFWIDSIDCLMTIIGSIITPKKWDITTSVNFFAI